MKKFLLILLITSATYSFVKGQKIKEADVPESVKTTFNKTYPGLNPAWEKEKENFEAGFKKDGKTMSATFQHNGVFMESEVTIKESELPATAISYVKSRYKGKKIRESAKITTAAGVVSYEAEVNGKDLLFDMTGNFLKSIKD